MKLFKFTLICLSLCGVTMVSCRPSNGSGEDDKKEVLAETKKDNLFNYGKIAGYEINGTVVVNDSTTHYKAAMKGNVLYFNYAEKSGGGWNYMAFKLEGNTCYSGTYLEDLSQFGSPQERNADAFRSGFETSLTPFYEACNYRNYEDLKFLGNETLLGMNAYKFEYSSPAGGVNVMQTITCFVEEEYGLTLKMVIKYTKGEEVTYLKETTVTSFKKGSDVVIPNFDFSKQSN